MARNCFVCIELYEYVPTKSKRLIFITMNLMQSDWKRNLHSNTKKKHKQTGACTFLTTILWMSIHYVENHFLHCNRKLLGCWWNCHGSHVLYKVLCENQILRQVKMLRWRLSEGGKESGERKRQHSLFNCAITKCSQKIWTRRWWMQFKLSHSRHVNTSSLQWFRHSKIASYSWIIIKNSHLQNGICLSPIQKWNFNKFYRLIVTFDIQIDFKYACLLCCLAWMIFTSIEFYSYLQKEK